MKVKVTCLARIDCAGSDSRVAYKRKMPMGIDTIGTKTLTFLSRRSLGRRENVSEEKIYSCSLTDRKNENMVLGQVPDGLCHSINCPRLMFDPEQIKN